MKTFNDLQFISHPVVPSGKQAKIFFPNGYGASVVGGPMLYGDGVNTFELAVVKGDEANWNICYDTNITNDVMGHLTPEEITETLKQIQEL